MPWLLLLHICALLCWAAALLYLPALISGFARTQTQLQQITCEQGERSSLPRLVFTLFATPAALIAIASGTAVFVVNGIIEFWLVAKLTLVTLLVGVHSLCGLLVLRAEQHQHRHLNVYCALAAAISAGLVGIIFWLVLAKPLQEV